MKVYVLFGIILVLGAVFVHADLTNQAYITVTLLNQKDDPAVPGKYVEIRWKVEKKGNPEINGLVFELQPEYPFFFDGSDKAVKEVGSWEGNSKDDEYYTLYYKLKVDDDALEGSYKLKLRYKHDKIEGWATKEFDVRVADRARPDLVIGTLQTSPAKLLPDIEEAKLELSLENIGDGDAENVVADIELPEGFRASYAYSDRSNLGTIEADGSDTATLYIDIDEGVKSGLHKARLNVKYKEADDEDNEYKEIVLPLELPVHSKPMFKIVSSKTVPADIRPGDAVELRVVLKNVGNKEAESVSLRAFKESSQPFEFDEKSDFVGRLKPGDSGEAVIKFDVDPDADAKKYILDLEIRSIYEDEVLVQDKTAVIKVADGDKHSINAVGALIVVAIVVIGMGLYFWLRKQS